MPADPVDAVRAELRAELAADENVLTALAVDLDDALRFVPGALALTDRRFWARSPDGGWRSWPLTPELALRHADHAGVGSLELCDAHRRLARWRFTLACNPQALALLAAFERQQARRAGQGEADDEADQEQQDTELQQAMRGRGLGRRHRGRLLRAADSRIRTDGTAAAP